jgi:hypothetical protein
MKKCVKIFEVILFLTSLISLGCHKNDKTYNSIMQDDILYTNIQPDTSETSIRYWNLGRFPYPADSTALIYFDVDNDYLMDIYAGIYTHFYWVSASNPDNNYSYGSGLVMVNELDSIAVLDITSPLIIAKHFHIDSIIDNNSKYFPNGSTYKTWSGDNPFTCNTFNGDTYYGFKISKIGGYNFGWILLSISTSINKLTIKEFAINRTLNKPIKAGQKK